MTNPGRTPAPESIAAIVRKHRETLSEGHPPPRASIESQTDGVSLDKALAGSDFIARSLASAATWKALAPGIGNARAVGEITETINQIAASTDNLSPALRRIRNQEIARIGWRDLAGMAPLSEVITALSELADASIEAALSQAHHETVERFGEPIGETSGKPVRMTVFGLGKLGGRELNMSSDVDLIFAFQESGVTDGPKSISNHEFFIKVGQRLIDLLQRPTAEGIAFRVDMRLRPNGESGPLALSFDAIDHYYLTHGRDWERYALIKARPVAGDREAGDILLSGIRPFVYRKYLDFGAIDAIRSMKSLIEQELAKKSLAHNVKLGRGGIREIEFIVQSHQLIFGGRNHRLQTQSLYDALEELARSEVLPATTCAELREHYEFLRTVEHRLQILDDRQTHTLPSDELALARVAYASGFQHPDALLNRLTIVTDAVHRQFESVFRYEESEPQQTPDIFQTLWRSAMANECDTESCRGTAFGDPEKIVDLLASIPRSRFYQSFSREGRERLDRLMPVVLARCADSEDPDTALARVTFVIQSIGRRSAYLAMLYENQLALSQLVKLVCASSEVSQWIAQHPVILDELLDPIAGFEALDDKSITQELGRKLDDLSDDLEAAMERLREFRQAFTLRVAAADLAGLIDTQGVATALSALARAVLIQSVRLAERTLNAIDKPDEAMLGIIAYGKLGSGELGYHSDLDIVFVFEEPDGESGERASARRHYFGRLVQRLTHILTTKTPAGDAYMIDTRLRPSGNSGTVVTPLRAYAEYLEHDAWTWEHQALVRARLVVGSPSMQVTFDRIRNHLLCQARDIDTLKADVLSMRRRMWEHQNKERKADDEFHLKHDPGGLIDIEFLCQYWVLAHAAHHPSLTALTSNRDIIAELNALGLLSRPHAQALAQALETYLAHENAIKLRRGESRVHAERFKAERESVRSIWVLTLGDRQDRMDSAP
jgi:glutamate-ammonia-ligase adenylyltransferase